ncbi:MAG: hypothetical protein ACOC5U_04065, partial [Candidatus Aminicenantaceae bacterium]
RRRGQRSRSRNGCPDWRHPRGGGQAGLIMFITILYYILSAYIAALIIWNLIRSEKWQDEMLYIIILIPFILRVLGLK